MQSYSLLANKLAITDYLNNKNIYGDGELGEDYSGAYGGNTRNSIRGNRSHRSYGYDPMEGPGTPGERRVPNQRPLPTLSAAAPKETGGGMDIFSLADKFKKLYAQPGSSSNSGSGQYSGAGGSGGGGISSSTISNTSNVPGKEQIAKLATTQTQKKQQPMGVNAPPDQPLNKFSMAATDEPGGINDSLYKHVEMIEEQAAANTKWNRFKEAMKSGPGWDKFGRVAGDIAAAIGGRGTSQGRMGAIGSRWAGERIAERKAAPDVARARMLKAAQIKKAEAPEGTPMYKNTPEGLRTVTARSAEEMKSFEEQGFSRGGLALTKTKRESGIKYDEEKKAWFKGHYDEEGNFDALRKLTPAEKKSQVTGGDSGKYHYVQDDSGKVSIFQDGKLIRGSGKGKKVSGESNKGVYVSSMNQILKEYGGSGTSFKTNPDGSFSFSAGGEKEYKDMVKQASEGNTTAKRNLSIYNSVKEKLIGLSGVDIPKSTQKSSWKDYQ